VHPQPAAFFDYTSKPQDTAKKTKNTTVQKADEQIWRGLGSRNRTNRARRRHEERAINENHPQHDKKEKERKKKKFQQVTREKERNKRKRD
jgi:hypothetical protein